MYKDKLAVDIHRKPTSTEHVQLYSLIYTFSDDGIPEGETCRRDIVDDK
jgi:hypothetical protein